MTQVGIIGIIQENGDRLNVYTRVSMMKLEVLRYKGTKIGANSIMHYLQHCYHRTCMHDEKQMIDQMKFILPSLV